MTLSTTISSVSYVGNGVTTVFDFGFEIPASALVVTLTENDTVTTLDPAAYTASGLGSGAGGSVILKTAPTRSQTVTLRRVLTLTQPMALVTGAAIYADVIENAHDRHTMIHQQLQEQIDRAVMVPVGSDIEPTGYLTALTSLAAESSAAAAAAAASAGQAVFAHLAAVRALSGPDLPILSVRGHSVTGDGGEGFFVYDSTDTSSADNGGTVLVDTTGRRYKRAMTDGVFNVKWFGARGDGTTDDTIAIKSAVSAANVVGGDVYIPSGTYVWSSSAAAVLGKGVIVRGSGKNSTKITCNNPSSSVFLLTGSGATVSHMGFTASVTLTGGVYVSLAGFDTVAEHLYIEKDIVGLNMIPWCANPRIQYVDFGPGITGGVRIDVVNGDTPAYISNVLTHAQSSNKPLAGIRLTNSTALVIENTSILTHNNGMLIAPGAGQIVSSIKVSNTYFDTGCNGLYVAPTSSTAGVSRLDFINCWFGDGTGQGVLIDNPKAAYISGLNFIGANMLLNAGSGISTSGTMSDINILGGVFAQNAYGMYFGHTGNVKVIAADIGGYQGTTGNNIGVFFGPGISSIIFSGNQLYGNTVAAILDNAPASAFKKFSDNIIPGHLSMGAITVGASPFSYTPAFDQTVYITGGTVSQVTLSKGTSMGYPFAKTDVSVRVRYGETLIVTYTAAPYMNYSE